ncbi:MAG: C-GCAxxG-C-C family protein [Pseudomonadota bacterium]
MNETALHMMRLAGKGYSCGQILISLALYARGEDNPGLVRSLAGLANGCGTGLGSCGVLTGGSCVLALYAGKGADDEEASPLLQVMLEELTDWFEEKVANQYGGPTCRDIVGDDGPEASRMKCGGIVAETFDRVMAILGENGFDPTGGD